jgi:hypothetical protein
VVTALARTSNEPFFGVLKVNFVLTVNFENEIGLLEIGPIEIEIGD